MIAETQKIIDLIEETEKFLSQMEKNENRENNFNSKSPDKKSEHYISYLEGLIDDSNLLEVYYKKFDLLKKRKSGNVSDKDMIRMALLLKWDLGKLLAELGDFSKEKEEILLALRNR